MDFKNCSYEEQRAIMGNSEFIHRFQCLQAEQDRLNSTIRALLRDMRASQELNSVDDGPFSRSTSTKKSSKTTVSRGVGGKKKSGTEKWSLSLHE